MTESRPRVTYRRQVPAEQYGSETFELSLDAGDWDDATIAGTLACARRLVEAELANSPNRNVRRVITPGPPVTVPADDDDPEDLPY